MTIHVEDNHRPLRASDVRVAISALAALGLLGWPAGVAAQTVLPGIVVEGATLAKPAPAPAPEPQQAQPKPPLQPAAATPAPSQPQAQSDTAGASAAPATTAAAPGTTGPTSAPGTGTGSATATSAADGFARETIGSAVSVVTSADLANSQVRNAAEALRSLPGVSVSHGGSAVGQTQVRLRGAEANHTLVLIDGIVANQPGTGEFDFSNLPADQIERIEVVRGAQSGLYGSGAIGGVVNVVTKRGQGPAKVTIWGEVGSFKTVESGASVSGGNAQGHGLLSYSVRNTNGFNIAPFGSETDAAQHRTLVLKGGIAPARNVTVDVMVRNVDKRGDRDNDLFTGSGLSHQIDGLSHLAGNIWLAAIEGRQQAFEGRLDHRVKYAFAQTTLEDTEDGAFGRLYDKNRSTRRNAAYLATLHLDTPALQGVLRHSLTGLVEHETELFIQITGDNLTRERNKLATAAEYRAELFGRLNVTGNVRHDDNDVFADFTTWRTTASLSLSEWGLRPHASYGTGVKLPTMIEQFGQFTGFVANPNLKAEESEGWDAGLEISIAKGAFIFDATYFNSRLVNQILTRYQGLNTLVENVPGESTRKGVELTARWRPVHWLSLGGSYTWLDAREENGRPEQRRPRDSGRVDATGSFHDGRGAITVAATYNGRMFDDAALNLDTFQNVRVTLDDYWLATLTARYKLKPGLEIYGRVENAFDTRYQEIYGFETAGIAAYAGLKVTFGGEK